MTEFGQFYQQGGVFMHLVTLLSLAAAGILATHAVRLRTLAKRVLAAKPAGESVDFGLVGGLTLAAIMSGVLGATFGFMELAGALRTIPAAQHDAALLRALPLAVTPFAWALMLGTPLVLGRAVVSSIDNRLRRLSNATA